MRNLHKIITNQIPLEIRLAATYWDQNHEETPDDSEFRIGWSPSHPRYIFWDHYESESIYDWGMESARNYRERTKNIEVDYSVCIIDMDELYSIREIEEMAGA